MNPFFFGSDARRLFGLFEPAAPGEASRAAVLFFNPFAHEAIHAHRLYRVLAQRLTRAGYDTMRFDYYGSGDSAGEDVEAALAGWAADGVSAHEELATRTNATRVVWFGARLGAAVAAQASYRVARPPERLVLWDPIVDGSAYLAELTALHARSLEISYAGVDDAWRALPAAELECMGFELGRPLRESLAALTAATFPEPRAARCEVICGGEPQTLALAASWQRAGLHVTTTPLENAFDWTTEDFESVLVPPEALARLTEALTRS